MKTTLVFLSLIILVESFEAGKSERGLGNFLDVSWNLPEPQGAPRSDCERDIQDMYSNLRNLTLWAFEMWDASARAPSGLLQGNQGHYGNWDECVGEPRPADGSLGMPRQYCIAHTYLRSFPTMEYPEDRNPHDTAYGQLYKSSHGFTLNGSLALWGFCAPASCNHTELSTLLQDHFHNESLKIHEASRIPEAIQESNDTVRHEVQAKVMSPYLCQDTNGYSYLFFGPGTVSFLLICAFAVVIVLASSCSHWYKRRKMDDGDKGVSDTVKALSLISNMKRLCYQGPEELPVLNGLRMISILYVVMGHRFMYSMHFPHYNWSYFEKFTTKFEWTFVTSGDLVVDNFFLISGILTSYKLLKWEPGSSMNFGKLIFSRYFRLFPVYIMAIMYTANVLPLMGSGPLWIAAVGMLAKDCKFNWWTNLLMVNNYVKADEGCLGQTWYTACIFHYFLISLSVLWLLRSKPKVRIGLLYLSSLLFISILIPALISYFMKISAIPPMTMNLLSSYESYRATVYMYFPSHTRASPYLIGLFTGYLLVQHQKSASKILSFKSSILITLAALTVIFGIISSRFFTSNLSAREYPVQSALYIALHRPLWAVAICSLILSCTLGDVPVVTSFLGWSPWAPLARLGYGVFLVHIAVQNRSLGVMKASYNFEFIEFFGDIAGDLFYSYLGAFVLYLFVEAPCRGIVRNLFISSNNKIKDLGNTLENNQSGQGV